MGNILYCLFFILIGWISFFAGVWGFAQIIGGLKTVKIRGLKKTLYTVFVWIALLSIITSLVIVFLPKYILAYCIGMIIALVRIILVKKASWVAELQSKTDKED